VTEARRHNPFAAGRRAFARAAASSLLAGALALAAAGAPAPSSAAPPASGAAATPASVSTRPLVPRHPVIVVLAPFLTFDDLSAARTPELWNTIEEGALGAVNARTAEYGDTSVAGGALTLGASRWAIGPLGGPLDAAALDRAREANASSLAMPAFGALGGAIHAGGGRTAALGASDTDTSSPAGRLRYAQLVATDDSGNVDVTGPDALIAEPGAPFGLRTDVAALRGQLASTLAGALPSGSAETTRQLVVIDVGDLERAHDATTLPAAARRAAHAAALSTLDAVVRNAREQAASADGLLVVIPVATAKYWYEAPEFGPLVVFGEGFDGTVVSASTKRPGLATNLDIAPTVLAKLDLTPPAAMLGKPLSSRADARDVATRVASLSRMNDSVGAIDRTRDAWFIRWFCWAAGTLVVLAAALVLLSARRRMPALAMLAEVALTLVLAAFPAAWLMFALNAQPSNVTEVVRAFVTALAAVAGLAFAVRAWFPRTRVAEPLFLTALANITILADQWLGHPIESGLFSYSTAAGWRFYGMGNEGAAIVVGASIATVGLLADALAERPRAASAVRRFGMPVMGLVVLVTAAAPFAGANAGVAVWGVVAYAVAWAAMNRVRLTWRVALLTLGAVAAAVVAFAALDLARSDGGTHLARFASGILRGDVASTGELIWRKLQNNLNYLPQTPYTGLAAAIAVAFAALRFAPSRPLRAARESAPALGAAVLGIFVGCLAAWVTEDSGIVMPALMMLAGAVPLVAIALRGPRPE